MSNTLDTPTRCLRSQHTPKPEQEPSTAPSLVVQEGPRRTHIKLAHVLLQFDLAPREVLPGTAPQRGRDPLLAPQPDLRERHSHDRKITEHWETKRLQGQGESQASTTATGWSPAASQTRKSVPEPLGCRNGSQGCTGELPEAQQRLCGLQTAPNKPGTASKPDPAGSWKSKHWSQGEKQVALST